MMSESEFYEFLNDSVGVATQSLMGFITVFFGYLLCAYFVGRKLTLIQVASISLAYSIFATTNLMTIFYTLSRIGEVASRYPEYYAHTDRAAFFTYVMPATIGFVWIMSLVYMASEYRKSGHDG